MKNKVTPSIDKKEFDGKRFQLLRQSRRISKTELAKSTGKIRSLHRFEFGLINLFSALFCCVFFGGCANDNQSDDQSQHRQHHRGNGQSGGGYDRSGASQSATPIPGL